VNEEDLAHWGLSRQKKERKKKKNYTYINTTVVCENAKACHNKSYK